MRTESITSSFYFYVTNIFGFKSSNVTHFMCFLCDFFSLILVVFGCALCHFWFIKQFFLPPEETRKFNRIYMRRELTSGVLVCWCRVYAHITIHITIYAVWQVGQSIIAECWRIYSQRLPPISMVWLSRVRVSSSKCLPNQYTQFTWRQLCIPNMQVYKLVYMIMLFDMLD